MKSSVIGVLEGQSKNQCKMQKPVTLCHRFSAQPTKHVLLTIISYFVRSFVRSLIHSVIHSFCHSFIPSVIHSFSKSVSHFSFHHSLVRSFVRSFICSFIHSFIHSFRHSGSHSFKINYASKSDVHRHLLTTKQSICFTQLQIY